MSEQRVMPEVLPGDLITRPGLYESRGGVIVPITGWEDNWWIAEWDGARDWYASDGRRRFYEAAGADEYQLLHWVGPLPASEPEAVTTTEQLAEIEGQGDTVQVREGRWKTRGGDIRNVTATPEGDGRKERYPWWDAQYQQTWTSDGRYYPHTANQWDLIEYLGPIEQQPVPQPQPPMLQDADERIRLLKQANDAQAETIGRLQTEARDLNMEIGGLERRLSERDARIRDLETIYSAATKSFEDANKANDALRAQVRILQREDSRKASRIEFLETLNAGNGAAIDDYRAKAEKLQGLVDTARQQLEAAATERDELRAAIDASDKQLDQKDAQIRDLRIELDAAQQVPQPVGDEERERIWDEATEAAGRQVVRWLRPLTLALHRQPDERFSRFMAVTLSVLPDLLPELLGTAEPSTLVHPPTAACDVRKLRPQAEVDVPSTMPPRNPGTNRVRSV